MNGSGCAARGGADGKLGVARPFFCSAFFERLVCTKCGKENPETTFWYEGVRKHKDRVFDRNGDPHYFLCGPVEASK